MPSMSIGKTQWGDASLPWREVKCIIQTIQQYLKYPYVRYTLVVGTLIALCSSLLGVTLVLRWFSFIGAGHDVVKVATTISITNTVVWEQTTEGTKEMFENENAAQGRFYDKMAAPGCACASVADRKKMRKKFSEEYYDKDKK